jgi:hypothetical protein
VQHALVQIRVLAERHVNALAPLQQARENVVEIRDRKRVVDQQGLRCAIGTDPLAIVELGARIPIATEQDRLTMGSLKPVR